MRTREVEVEPVLVRRVTDRLRAAPVLAQDTALAGVLAATLVADLARADVPLEGPMRAADPLGYVLVALLVLPLALRRRWPVGVFVVIVVDATLVATLLYPATSYGFGLIVATYTVARWTPPQISVWAFGLAQGFGVYAKLRASAAGLDIGWFEWPLDAVYFGAAWFLGRSIRSRQQYATALEHSREVLAERAVDEERARIARELHDAIGHALSVILLHAAATERILDRDPEQARKALRSVDEVGRSALAEMDRFLGLLRADDNGPAEALRPGLANLSDLVEEFEGVGLDIAITLDGEVKPLPPPVDQAAFRIIQEALTNAAKHAGPTRVEISVVHLDDEVTLHVRDHGRGPGRRVVAPVAHDERGIAGMRERVALHHGELIVGPCADGGYAVAVRLPLVATVRR